MTGVGQDLSNWALFNLSAGVHHQHPISNLRDHTKIMRNKEHGQLPLSFLFPEKRQNIGLNGHVQGGRGLICNEQLRRARQRHGNHHPLSLPARQLMGKGPQSGARIGNLHHRQQIMRFCQRFPVLEFQVALQHLLQLLANR